MPKENLSDTSNTSKLDAVDQVRAVPIKNPHLRRPRPIPSALFEIRDVAVGGSTIGAPGLNREATGSIGELRALGGGVKFHLKACLCPCEA